MKIKNITQVHDFLSAVDKCTGPIWLQSDEGDRYNLKSELSQYIAIGALLKEKGDWLELFCDNKDDEAFIFEFLNNHPEVV